MKYIKLTLCCFLFIITIVTYGQKTSVIPSAKELVAYKLPRNEMYKKGWIDFNKNGVMDTYEDPGASLDARVENLLSQMTVEEKTCQMVTLYGFKRVLTDDLPTPAWKTKLWKDGMGAIDEHLNGFQQWGLPPSDNPFVWPASLHAWALNEVQRFFIEETRLGVPVDFTNEGIRGVESFKATNFPTQLGIGHTWNRELVHRIGTITGREARLLGYTNIYAPVLDVGRDQRWGRYEEVYGESPYLVAELGIEMAKGLQKDYQVAATAKHFIAYSNNKGAREGMARVDPQMSPREVENIHVYPWKRVIKEGGILGAMSSYNDYDGFPIQSSYYWLTTRLRQDMGFRGYVVSDSDAVEYLYSKHGTAIDMKEAVLQAVEAGLNVRCTFRSPESFVLALRELIAEGAIAMETINDRVRDILRVKFLIGLFDTPYQMDLKQADMEVNSLKNQKIALQASRESIVLLKNSGKTLPLSKESVKTISVCGPNADDTSYALTHYGPLAVEVTTILQGIKEKVGEKVHVLYTQGCQLVDKNWPESEILPQEPDAKEKAEIEKAVENARKSDVAIVVLGGNNRTCGENKSRTSLELPGHQLQLLQAVVSVGKPVVLVLVNGRPLAINWADKYVDAILEAWYPGSQGGKAVADILFGDYNPGGKLTVTFPKTVGQIPFNFPYKPSSQVDGGNKPGLEGDMSRVNGALYPFGYGLSYTTFEYSGLTVSPERITPKQETTVRFSVKNTGNVAGDEVVQLYIRDLLSSVTTFEKNLCGFERVHLAPGESKVVTFKILPRDLELMNRKGDWVVEPGEFKLMVGASSEDIRQEKSLWVLPYSECNILERKTSSGSYLSVLDNDPNTCWTGNKGDYLNIPMNATGGANNIGIRWKVPAEKFEIQVSAGGGQFLTIYNGFSETAGEMIFYPLDKKVISDIRILLTQGSASISEIKIDGVKM
ncbi:glycoside hydrolase family 3 C-terminal domain-containing protein [Bacteroides finegoldii]|uniref:glycoside hydrolase family 3 C-terminal domain-containing protein n=1 Tax=Bacteroides finegoldii TaxID=338188 RepID=UPI00234C8DF9|nr:glycoside hydrolase family 3 C-terminal domain-containing protein [Bacteroides finegoldii]MDC7139187.1 glycoside hydrolase family 3 C-terminal domain-containing protein [Bacteroides finegoldii]